MRSSWCALLVTLGAAGLPAGAQEYLQATLWRELEPLYEPGEAYPVPVDEVARRLLSEARFVVSAMVYGVRFSYDPADARREIPGSFAAALIAEIPWGDAELTTADAWTADARRLVTFRYWLRQDQQDRRRAWSSNELPLARGTGTAELLGGHAMREVALEAALEDALRNYLRARITKPRRVTGELLLWSPPTTIIDRGNYITTVTVKIHIDELFPYRVF